MLRGLPGNNTRSVLVREQLLDEHLPSVMHIGIHPSSRRIHHSPSSGSAPISRHSRDSSIVPKWNATMHMYEINIRHLFLDIDGDQPNSIWRVLLLSFSSSWAVIYRVALQHNLVHERNGVVFKILLGHATQTF